MRFAKYIYSLKFSAAVCRKIKEVVVSLLKMYSLEAATTLQKSFQENCCYYDRNSVENKKNPFHTVHLFLP